MSINLDKQKQDLLLRAINLYKCRDRAAEALGVKSHYIAEMMAYYNVSGKYPKYFIARVESEGDSLNIEHHRKVLLLKALNKFSQKNIAAIELGIGERTLYRYISMYNVKGVYPKYFIPGFCAVKSSSVAGEKSSAL